MLTLIWLRVQEFLCSNTIKRKVIQANDKRCGEKGTVKGYQPLSFVPDGLLPLGDHAEASTAAVVALSGIHEVARVALDFGLLLCIVATSIEDTTDTGKTSHRGEYSSALGFMCCSTTIIVGCCVFSIFILGT